MIIRLRELSYGDSERVLAWRNREEIRKWMYNDELINIEEHESWISNVLADSSRKYWVIEIDDIGVGTANLAQIDPHNSRCTWAFYLADPTVKGLGVGAATEYLVISYVFEALKLNRLWCEVLSTNVSVIEMHERFGFRREGYLRSHVNQKDGPRDVVVLALLAGEWNLMRDQQKSALLRRGIDFE